MSRQSLGSAARKPERGTLRPHCLRSNLSDPLLPLPRSHDHDTQSLLEEYKWATAGEASGETGSQTRSPGKPKAGSPGQGGGRVGTRVTDHGM